MTAITADAFAEQLRSAGCRVTVDRSFTGAVYLRAEADEDPVTIVFEGDRFKRAFAVSSAPRRRWPKFRTMKSVRAFLGVPEAPAAAKPRTLRRDDIGFGYVTSDGRYEVYPAYTPPCFSLGGTTRRPSYWLLKDLHGEYETVDRPLLADIRDILKELP